VAVNSAMPIYYVYEYWRTCMHSYVQPSRVWQNSYLSMQCVSFLSCIFYIDALRRIRKTINRQRNMKSNECVVIFHICLIVIYFASIVTKSLSEQDYINSLVSNSETLKTKTYNRSLICYTVTVWLSFAFQVVLVRIIL
jgi:hypothetical protein